jgi:hypothetical protein
MSMASPGMATTDSLQAHPSAFEHTMFLNSLNHILRTGRCVATGIGQIGRQNPLVYTNQPYEYEFHFMTCNDGTCLKTSVA